MKKSTWIPVVIIILVLSVAPRIYNAYLKKQNDEAIQRYMQDPENSIENIVRRSYWDDASSSDSIKTKSLNLPKQIPGQTNGIPDSILDEVIKYLDSVTEARGSSFELEFEKFIDSYNDKIQNHE